MHVVTYKLRAHFWIQGNSDWFVVQNLNSYACSQMTKRWNTPSHLCVWKTLPGEYEEIARISLQFPGIFFSMEHTQMLFCCSWTNSACNENVSPPLVSFTCCFNDWKFSQNCWGFVCCWRSAGIKGRGVIPRAGAVGIFHPVPSF